MCSPHSFTRHEPKALDCHRSSRAARRSARSLFSRKRVPSSMMDRAAPRRTAGGVGGFCRSNSVLIASGPAALSAADERLTISALNSARLFWNSGSWKRRNPVLLEKHALAAAVSTVAPQARAARKASSPSLLPRRVFLGPSRLLLATYHAEAFTRSAFLPVNCSHLGTIRSQ
jgi:hypothetical protein